MFVSDKSFQSSPIFEIDVWVEEHPGTPILGRIQVLTANICEKVTNALAFLAFPSVEKEKKTFYESDTRGQQNDV